MPAFPLRISGPVSAGTQGPFTPDKMVRAACDRRIGLSTNRFQNPRKPWQISVARTLLSGCPETVCPAGQDSTPETLAPERVVARELGVYHRGMATFRLAMLVLAIAHALFVGLTALAGAFADGGDIWSRLVLALVHPLCAVGMLALTWQQRPATPAIIAAAFIMVLNVAADLALAQLIAAGSVKGDRWLPLSFSIVPAIGIVYALMMLRASRPTLR